MAQQKEPRVKLPPPCQIGIVVEDVERAIDYYSSIFGWGPFEIAEMETKGIVYRGQPYDCRVKIATTQLGPIEVELVETMEGETPHTEFLRERGEGLFNLCFEVDNLNDMLAELAKDGIEPIYQHDFPEMAFAFLSSDRVGGVLFELLHVKTQDLQDMWWRQR